MEWRCGEGAAPRRVLSNFTSVFRFVSQIIKEKTGSHPSLFSQNVFFFFFYLDCRQTGTANEASRRLSYGSVNLETRVRLVLGRTRR